MNTIDTVRIALNSMENAKRENRQKVADFIIKNNVYFNDLIRITFETANKESIKAAWVLEWICTHGNLHLLLPHLDVFIENISKVTFDSVVRPCAKICEHLATAYTSPSNNSFQQKITNKHIDAIIETGFDWLISPQKIAVRAYTMTTLYLFGLHKDWVHPELEHLIKTKIIKESAGCKSRGTKVLQLIKKHQKI